MRTLGIVLVLACATFAGCAPKQTITPGSRIIYNGGIPVWSTCDRGNLLYFSQGSPNVAVVPGGCPSGSP